MLSTFTKEPRKIRKYMVWNLASRWVRNYSRSLNYHYHSDIISSFLRNLISRTMKMTPLYISREFWLTSGILWSCKQKSRYHPWSPELLPCLLQYFTFINFIRQAEYVYIQGVPNFEILHFDHLGAEKIEFVENFPLLLSFFEAFPKGRLQK